MMRRVLSTLEQSIAKLLFATKNSANLQIITTIYNFIYNGGLQDK